MQIFNGPVQSPRTSVSKTRRTPWPCRPKNAGLAAIPGAGRILHTEVPAVMFEGVIWSGLRLEEAILRAFTMDDRPVRFTVQP